VAQDAAAATINVCQNRLQKLWL